MEMTHLLKAPVMILARNSKTSSKHNQTSPWWRHARTVSSLQPFLGSPATVLQSKLFTAYLREVDVQQCFTSTNNAWHGQRWTQFCVHKFQQTSKVIRFSRFSSKMWRLPKLVMDDHSSTETLWRLGDPPAIQKQPPPWTRRHWRQIIPDEAGVHSIPSHPILISPIVWSQISVNPLLNHRF